MFSDRNYTYSGKCCTDCLMLLANGETPPELSEEETAGYLANVERECAGAEITLGMFREDHGCAANWTVIWHAPGSVRGSFRRGTIEVRADSYRDALDEAEWSRDVPAGAWPVMARSHDLETESDRGGECECEQLGFSWSSCDVCGSNLGGDREAVVFWFAPPAGNADQPGSGPAGALPYSAGL
jgi:hypothetical protein